MRFIGTLFFSWLWPADPPRPHRTRAAQRLGAVDDEQPADLRVEPAFDQIVDERLHDGGFLGRPFDQAERVLIAEEAL
jgi:hypothetical protein